MNTSLRHLWVICIPIFFAACAQDHYLNGASQFRIGTQNSNGTSNQGSNGITPPPDHGDLPFTYISATQNQGVAMTPNASGNWLMYPDERADTEQEFTAGIFTPKYSGVYSITCRVAFAAPGVWANTDYLTVYISKSDGSTVATDTRQASAGSPAPLQGGVHTEEGVLLGQSLRCGVFITRNLPTYQLPSNPYTNIQITSVFKSPQ